MDLPDLAARLTPRTIVSVDDLLLLVPRAQWHVLRSMRPRALNATGTVGSTGSGGAGDGGAGDGGAGDGGAGAGGAGDRLQCPRLCNAQYRHEFGDLDGWAMPTHCLMRTHFARYGVMLVDVGLMLPPEALLVETSVRAARRTERIGRLGAPSMIVRLRPRNEAVSHRAAARDRDLQHARDWENSNRSIRCEVAAVAASGSGPMASEHSCDAYAPVFHCSVCAGKDAAAEDCPGQIDLFLPRHPPSTSPHSRPPPPALCAACCLHRTCATAGCAALAAVVPTNSAGNVFAARYGSSANVLARTGRHVACNRIREAICATAGTGSSVGRGALRGRGGGLGEAADDEQVSAAAAALKAGAVGGDVLRARGVGAEVAAAELDLRLVHTACALNASGALDGVDLTDDWLVAAVKAAGGRPLGEGGPASMHSARYFRPDDQHGWMAYFVLQMFEDAIVHRLMRAARAGNRSSSKRHGRPGWLETTCRRLRMVAV